MRDLAREMRVPFPSVVGLVVNIRGLIHGKIMVVKLSKKGAA
jgi:hypothetical protein